MGGVVSARAREIEQGIVLTLAVLARPELTAGASDGGRGAAVGTPLRSGDRLHEPGPVRCGPPAERQTREGDREGNRMIHPLFSSLEIWAREVRVGTQ